MQSRDPRSSSAKRLRNNSCSVLDSSRTRCDASDRQQPQQHQPATNSRGHTSSQDDETEEIIVRKSMTENEEESGGQIIMSVFRGGGKFAAAAYDSESAEVYLLRDTEDVPPDYTLLKQIVNQLLPRHIVVSVRQDDSFINVLKSYVKANATEDESAENEELSKPTLHFQPSLEFAEESCKRRIILLKLQEEAPSAFTEESHLFLIHSYVDFQATAMVRAFGALLKFLDKEAVNLELVQTNKQILVVDIKTLNLKEVVTIDQGSYNALQIFSHDWHPSVYKRGGFSSRSKEGLSLFGILNRCRSTVGAKFMRIFFLQPTQNVRVLQQRQEVIEFCKSVRNSEITKAFAECLRHVKNASRLIAKITNLHASVREWKSFYKTAYNAMLIGQLCSAQPQQINLFRKIFKCLTPDLLQMVHSLGKSINFEDSLSSNKIVINLGVDEDLDKKKQQHNGLPSLLSRLIQSIMEKSPQLESKNQECSMMFVPDLGYLLAIKVLAGKMTEEEKKFSVPGMDFVFENANVMYFKNDICKELDVTVGDCYYQVLEHENKLVAGIAELISKSSAALLTLVRLVAELDCLISLATVAAENNYSRPTVTNDSKICILNGRHPLQELCVDTFVPNDTFSGGEFGTMKILTGPNASGKSVYLKQVALIVYMAHIGSFVPASRAKIGIVDCIHTCIQTTETVSSGMSAFMMDVVQVSLQLKCSSKSSLLILDEFGIGTSDVDGLSLLTATLQHLSERGSRSPHVFVSTHFHKVPNLLGSSPLVKMQTMEILYNERQLVFLFKLIEGNVNSSLAFKVAESTGIEKKFIQRSMQVFDCLTNNKPIGQLRDAETEARMKGYVDIVSKFLEVESDPASISRFFRETIYPFIGKTKAVAPDPPQESTTNNDSCST